MKLVVDKESLVSVAEAIRTKGNTTDELEFPNGFVDGINAIESGGGDFEALWYEMSKEIKSLNGLFYESQLIKKFPKGEYDEVTDANSCFQYSSLEEIDFYLNLPVCTKASRMFADTPNLKRIVGISIPKVSGPQQMFSNSAIEVIEEPLDASAITIRAAKLDFDGCDNLREIRFVGNCLLFKITFSSPYLSDESIQSIIGGLKDLTGATAEDLVLHTDVKAKLTEEQIATITSKNWNLA